ncbi:MAG: aminoglycoside phosphotransferase family protein [Bdellovibrionales bacterium]|nr:aminoglycoside phosphotransferase family protein [Bdellovibrionales bacterium]
MNNAVEKNVEVGVEPSQKLGRTFGNHKIVDLTMLSWFLADYLPMKLPKLFDSNLIVRPIQEQGWSNYTFEVSGKLPGRYIVRMKACPTTNQAFDRNWSAYHKEAWIIATLGNRIPVAELIDEGIHYVGRKQGGREYAIMVQSHLECSGGHHLDPTSSKTQFLRRIASVCKSINETPTKGYGNSFDPKTESFEFSTWQECLDEWIAECPLGELVAREELSEAQATFFERRVHESLASLSFRPALFHGDLLLNWSNALVDPNGGIKGIIDWEFGGSGPAKYYELMTALYVMIRDGMGGDELDSQYRIIKNAYGISSTRYDRDYRHAVDALMMMQACKKVKRYILAELAGEMEGHPWRQAFAARARCLLHQLCAGQCAFQSTLLAA